MRHLSLRQTIHSSEYEDIPDFSRQLRNRLGQPLQLVTVNRADFRIRLLRGDIMHVETRKGMNFNDSRAPQLCYDNRVSGLKHVISNIIYFIDVADTA